MRPALNRAENELYPWLFVAMGPAGLLVFLEGLIPAVTLRPLMLVAGLAGFIGTFALLGTVARIGSGAHPNGGTLRRQHPPRRGHAGRANGIFRHPTRKRDPFHRARLCLRRDAVPYVISSMA